MADSYFAGFDLVWRDTDGVEIPLDNYTLTIAWGVVEIEVDSDENGFVNAILLEDIPPESEIEIYDDTGFYDGVLVQITKADATDAAIENKINRFVIEDNYEPTSETALVDIYAQDLSDLSVAPKKLGTVAPGETLTVPFESAVLKNLRIIKVQKDEEFAQSQTDLNLAEYDDFGVSSIVPEAETVIETGVTTVISGGSGNLLFNNGGIVGEIPADLPAPGADRIGFWDHSALKFTWLTVGSGLSITGTTLAATSSGLSIGNAVSGGGANRILFEDGSQNLATDADFTFDGTNLNIGQATETATLTVKRVDNSNPTAVFEQGGAFGGVLKLIGGGGAGIKFFQIYQGATEMFFVRSPGGGALTEWTIADNSYPAIKVTNTGGFGTAAEFVSGNAAFDHLAVIKANADGGTNYGAVMLDGSVATVNPTAATSGANQPPRYFALRGQSWISGASQTVVTRLKLLIGSGDYGGFAVEHEVPTIATGEIFSVKPSSTDTLVKFSSPNNPGVNGGRFKISSAGAVGVEDLSGSQAPLYASQIAVGHTSPSAALHVIKTTEQARFGYDTSNDITFTVGSNGETVIDGHGSAKGVKFASGMKLGFFGATPVTQRTTFTLATNGVSAGSDTVNLIDLTDTIEDILDNIGEIKQFLTDLGLTN